MHVLDENTRQIYVDATEVCVLNTPRCVWHIVPVLPCFSPAERLGLISTWWCLGLAAGVVYEHPCVCVCVCAGVFVLLYRTQELDPNIVLL